MKYYIKQLGNKDCGFASLKMLLAITYKNKDFLYYPQGNLDSSYSLKDIINIAKKEGVILKGSRFVDKEELFKLNKDKSPKLIPLKKDNFLHLVLIKRIYKKKVLIYDPDNGIYYLNKIDLFNYWNGEILEISKVNGSTFKTKKLKVYPKQFLSLTIIFQILSFSCLLIATLFIDNSYNFFIPLILFFGYILFEFLYQRILIVSMKYFDNTILFDDFLLKREDFKNYFVPMNKFKYILITTPINIVSSLLILIFGIFILGVNDYMSLLILFTTFLIQIIFKIIDMKKFNIKRRNLEKIEKELKDCDISEQKFKENIFKLNEETYSFVNFTNFKKYFLLFLTISFCLLYLGFTGNISINFMLFHFFMYLFLQEHFDRLIKMTENINEYKYHKCLYLYHFG